MLRSLLTIGQDGIETVIKSHFYEGGIPEMINQLHLAMIGLYHGDAERIQHFCKLWCSLQMRLKSRITVAVA